MVNQDIFASRLGRLHEYLHILDEIQEYSREEFLANRLIQGAAERYLHLSIEILLDLGNHMISDRGLRKPETYAEVFQILAEERVISKELLSKLEGMAAFRNLLVHDYLRIDLARVYELIKEKLPVLEELGKVYAAVLASN